MKFVRISQNFGIHTLAEHIRSYEIGTNLVRLSRESPNSVTLCMGTVQSYRTILCIPTGHGDGARHKEPFYPVADRTRRRCLQDLQQVVSREFGAPYTLKYLADTGQTLLTLERRGTRTVQFEPNMEERLILAAWWMRSLHLSRTEARYLVGSLTYGVVLEHVYGMLQQLALPVSWVVTAYTGDDTAIYGAARYLADRIGHLHKC